MAREISIKEYTYHLPDDRIAKHPLAQRDLSKLLVYKDGQIQQSVFNQICDYLPHNSFLVFNNTKVIYARILFEIEGKSKPIEIFLLEPSNSLEIQTAMVQKGKAKWNCLVGNNKSFKTDFIEKNIFVEGKEIYLKVYKPVINADCFEVALEWNEDLYFAEVLNFIGSIPLPPYLKRQVSENDKKSYQTIYAKEEGSVAAPTAGLHFTEAVLEKLNQTGHQYGFVQLHVGAGTFKPVKATQMSGHEMHAEEILVSLDFIKQLINQGENIIPVGTTSLRTLETLFWVGVKLKFLNVDKLDYLLVNQWDAYDLQYDKSFTYTDSLNEIENYLNQNKLKYLVGKTQILIAPGYEIKSSAGIITNFHQPDSTLLLLVAAMIGEKWRDVYQYALENDFRFLSFGDSSLLLRE